MRVIGNYDGGHAHDVAIQVYNYAISDWETKSTMFDEKSSVDYIFPINGDNQNASGDMQVRFLHNDITYQTSHVLYIDYMEVSKHSTNNAIASDIAAIVQFNQNLLDEYGNVSIDEQAVADTVRTELAPELANMDAPTSALETKVEADTRQSELVAEHDATQQAVEDKPIISQADIDEIKSGVKTSIALSA